MTAHAPLFRDLIERGATAHAGRTAMIVEGKTYSFADVNGYANRLANALGTLGIAKGSRVAILLNNGPASIPIDFALAKAGMNKVPLNARLSLAEHGRMIGEAQCDWLLFGADLAARARDLASSIDGLRAVGIGAALPGGVDIAERAAHEEPVAPAVTIAPDDVMLTLYTSGTTGVLKAAQHTQASYAAICRNILLNLFPVTPDDRMLHAASLIHASGTFVLPFWLRGGCSVILPGFAPPSYLAAIEEHAVTAINLVPTMLQMLLDDPAIDRHPLATLRHIIYGASPMPRPVIERAIARFGQHRFWQYFGQTEAPLCIAVLRPEDHHGDRLGACGRPALDVELRLIDDEGRDTDTGPGEVLLRSPTACAGYFNAPDINRETFDAEGWVHTRDVGYIDDAGFLHLLDRTSDMIISGGYNIYPREVEDALLSHPAVAEAAVVGAPDEKWVEAVVGFVVLRGEAVASEELIAHVARHIASYKKPHRIEIVDELPKTPIGKMDRKALRARLR